MTQMIQDIDIPCAVVAVGLSTQLVRIDALEETEIDGIISLISDSDGRIRHRAAEFIQDYRLEDVVNNLPTKTGNKKKKNQQSEEKQITTAKLLALLELIENKSSHRDLPDYLIEAFWGRCDVLTSWDTMTEVALNEVEISDSGMR
jgi:hypothetical protein